MTKKKTTAQSVAIEMADLVQNAPDQLQLPSGPSQGVYEKTFRDNSYGSNNGRNFYMRCDRPGARNYSSRESTSYRTPSNSHYSTNPELQQKVQSWKPANNNYGDSQPPRKDFSTLANRNTPDRSKTESYSSYANRPSQSRTPMEGSSRPSSQSSFDFAEVLKKRQENEKKVQLPISNLASPRTSRVRTPRIRTQTSVFDDYKSRKTGRSSKTVEEAPKKILDRKSFSSKLGGDRSNDKKLNLSELGMKNSVKNSVKDENDEKVTKIPFKTTKKEIKTLEKDENETETVKKEEIDENGLKNTEKEKISETKSEIKSETKSETKSEIKSEIKSETTKKAPEAKKIDLASLIQISEKTASKTPAKKPTQTFSRPVKSTVSRNLLSNYRFERKPSKNDLLSKLKKERLQAEAQKEKAQIAADEKEKSAKEKARLKGLEDLMRMKRTDSVEFYGHYRGSNETVSFELWRKGLKSFLEHKEKTLSEGFLKMTAWAWTKNLCTLQELAKTLTIYFLEKEKDSAEENSKSYILSMLKLIVSNSSEKDLEFHISKEKTDLVSCLNCKDDEELNNLLKANGLTFLCKEKSLVETIGEEIEKSTEPEYILNFLKEQCEPKKLKSEPEIAHLITSPIFIDYFSKIPSETRSIAATVKKSPSPKTSANSSTSNGQTAKASKAQQRKKEKAKHRNAKEAANLSEEDDLISVVTVAEKVSSFFAPSLNLLTFLAELSSRHQSQLLDALAAQWKANGGAEAEACGLMRALFSLGAVDYKGVTAWRSSVPSAGEEVLRREVLRAVVPFVAGDLEEAHQRQVDEERAEWEAMEAMEEMEVESDGVENLI